MHLNNDNKQKQPTLLFIHLWNLCKFKINKNIFDKILRRHLWNEKTEQKNLINLFAVNIYVLARQIIYMRATWEVTKNKFFHKKKEKS